MTDLVQRLRASVTQARALDRAALLHEAADEIERRTLTDVERSAAEFAIAAYPLDDSVPATLRSLLERLG